MCGGFSQRGQQRFGVQEQLACWGGHPRRKAFCFQPCHCFMTGPCTPGGLLSRPSHYLSCEGDGCCGSSFFTFLISALSSDNQKSTQTSLVLETEGYRQHWHDAKNASCEELESQSRDLGVPLPNPLVPGLSPFPLHPIRPHLRAGCVPVPPPSGFGLFSVCPRCWGQARGWFLFGPLVNHRRRDCNEGCPAGPR